MSHLFHLIFPVPLCLYLLVTGLIMSLLTAGVLPYLNRAPYSNTFIPFAARPGPGSREYKAWHEQFPDDKRTHTAYSYERYVGIGHSKLVLFAGDYIPRFGLERPVVPHPDYYLRYRIGFPFSCLQGEITGYKGARSESFLFRLSGKLIPSRPLVSGLIADTLLWYLGILLALSLWKPRARRRVRAGCCPTCGYDLRGDLSAGCSECGWGRKAEA